MGPGPLRANGEGARGWRRWREAVEAGGRRSGLMPLLSAAEGDGAVDGP